MHVPNPRSLWCEHYQVYIDEACRNLGEDHARKSISMSNVQLVRKIAGNLEPNGALQPGELAPFVSNQPLVVYAAESVDGPTPLAGGEALPPHRGYRVRSQPRVLHDV